MRLPYDGIYKITQLFGENPAMYAKFGLKGHNGIDFGLPNGTPVLAPHDGVIKEAYFDEFGYGWYVKIENSTEGSVLGHFMSIAVPIGQSVISGNKVGVSDNTGNSTGPHLHWGYYKFPRDRSNGYNGFINQYDLIKPLLEQDEMMQISKKTFNDLITKLDNQERLIIELKKDKEVALALKDTECLSKIEGYKKELKEKIIALIG